MNNQTYNIVRAATNDEYPLRTIDKQIIFDFVRFMRPLIHSHLFVYLELLLWWLLFDPISSTRSAPSIQFNSPYILEITQEANL